MPTSTYGGYASGSGCGKLEYESIWEGVQHDIVHADVIRS